MSPLGELIDNSKREDVDLTYSSDNLAIISLSFKELNDNYTGSTEFGVALFNALYYTKGHAIAEKFSGECNWGDTQKEKIWEHFKQTLREI